MTSPGPNIGMEKIFPGKLYRLWSCQLVTHKAAQPIYSFIRREGASTLDYKMSLTI